jgi:sulfotransferase
MKRKFYFISGLPRSGSTLLANLLLQNEKFHATSTSSLLDLILQLRDNWSSIESYKTNPEGQDKWKVIKAVIENYHNTDRPIIFDKNRGWTNHIEFLEKILGYEVRIICCVRNLEDVVSSFEKLFRENRSEGEIHSEFKNPKMKTLQGRCEVWVGDEGVIGRPYVNLKDAFDRGLESRLVLLPYEFFTHNPESAMESVYNFIGEPYFKHNFENIEQKIFENDIGYGWGENLHKIKEGKIVPAKSDARKILGDSLTELYSNKEFWKNLK